MANNTHQGETYYTRLERQKQYFAENYGCSISPSFYFIHFHDGDAHWMEYSWGWNLSYLNSKNGDPTPCGKRIFVGTALCQKCYDDNRDEILKKCQEFSKEIQENEQETIDRIIQNGKKVKIVTYRNR